MRLCWDTPVPERFAALKQREDGAWPTGRKGAEWLLDEAVRAGLCETGKQEAAAGLRNVAVLAGKLGHGDAAAQFKTAAEALAP